MQIMKNKLFFIKSGKQEDLWIQIIRSTATGNHSSRNRVEFYIGSVLL